MEQPMFYQGQRVVAQVTPKEGWRIPPNLPKPIDGKSYYVENPNMEVDDGLVFISISGFDGYSFWQGWFMPHDTDLALEEEIHQALNHKLLI